jgi:hypothetical protein
MTCRPMCPTSQQACSPCFRSGRRVSSRSRHRASVRRFWAPPDLAMASLLCNIGCGQRILATIRPVDALILYNLRPVCYCPDCRRGNKTKRQETAETAYRKETIFEPLDGCFNGLRAASQRLGFQESAWLEGLGRVKWSASLVTVAEKRSIWKMCDNRSR